MFWDRFVELCTERGKSPTAVVLELGLSRSSVTNWKRGGIPNNVAIKKIADYFCVTINYLIGKDAEVHISGNTLNGKYNVVGNNSHFDINEEGISAQENELLVQFRRLSEVGKAKALIYIAELEEKEKEKIKYC